MGKSLQPCIHVFNHWVKPGRKCLLPSSRSWRRENKKNEKQTNKQKNWSAVKYVSRARPAMFLLTKYDDITDSRVKWFYLSLRMIWQYHSDSLYDDTDTWTTGEHWILAYLCLWFYRLPSNTVPNMVCGTFNFEGSVSLRNHKHFQLLITTKYLILTQPAQCFYTRSAATHLRYWRDV